MSVYYSFLLGVEALRCENSNGSRNHLHRFIAEVKDLHLRRVVKEDLLSA